MMLAQYALMFLILWSGARVWDESRRRIDIQAQLHKAHSYTCEDVSVFGHFGRAP